MLLCRSEFVQLKYPTWSATGVDHITSDSWARAKLAANVSKLLRLHEVTIIDQVRFEAVSE